MLQYLAGSSQSIPVLLQTKLEIGLGSTVRVPVDWSSLVKEGRNSISCSLKHFTSDFLFTFPTVP